MANALQRIALNKLPRTWVLHYDERGQLETAETGSGFISMTIGESEALKTWFKAQRFSVGSGPDNCDVRVTEIGNRQETVIPVKSKGGFIDVEHHPKPKGDLQSFLISMSGKAYLALAERFKNEGWFIASGQIGLGGGRHA